MPIKKICLKWFVTLWNEFTVNERKIQIQSGSMSDPPLSDIDFNNKMSWVWATLKTLPWTCQKYHISTQYPAIKFPVPGSEYFQERFRMIYNRFSGPVATWHQGWSLKKTMHKLTRIIYRDYIFYLIKTSIRSSFLVHRD